jgi:hypothetical protein
MFQTFAQRFTQLDFLGARYYDNVNDGFDGNNNATDSLCVPRSPRPCSPQLSRSVRACPPPRVRPPRAHLRP